MRKAIITLVHCVTLTCATVPSVVLAQAAGRFLVVVGDVRIVDDAGNERAAARGGELRRGDTIKTANRSIAQVRFSDRGLVSVRSDSEMRLSRFKYSGPNDRKSSIAFNLLRGAMRSISGLIGRFKESSYELKTPHATIGIRGTDHETTVLLKPRGGLQAGTVNQVFSGQTVMRNNLGTVNVLPKQAAFIGAKGASRRPKIIPIPKFLKERAALPGAADARRGQAPVAKGKGKGKRKVEKNRKRVGDKPVRLNPMTSPTDKRKVEKKRKLVGNKAVRLNPTTSTTRKTLSPRKRAGNKAIRLNPTTSTQLKTLSPTTTIKK